MMNKNISDTNQAQGAQSMGSLLRRGARFLKQFTSKPQPIKEVRWLSCNDDT